MVPSTNSLRSERQLAVVQEDSSARVRVVSPGASTFDDDEMPEPQEPTYKVVLKTIFCIIFPIVLIVVILREYNYIS
ncbi:unnamed protein product [Caenorhabditis nigoni]